MLGGYYGVCVEEIPFDKGMAAGYGLIRNADGAPVNAVRFWIRWGDEEPIGNANLRGHHPKSIVPGLMAHLGQMIDGELHRDPHAVGRNWLAVFQRYEWPDHIKELPFEILWDKYAVPY